MSNLRGSQEKKRKLYVDIITSIVMYAAPIWADSLSSRRIPVDLDFIVAGNGPSQLGYAPHTGQYLSSRALLARLVLTNY